MNRDEHEVRKWMAEQAEYNDSFRGEDLNGEKVDSLKELWEKCRALSEIVPEIKCPTVLSDETDRHGLAQLYLPNVLVLDDDDAQKMLADLLTGADHVVISALNGEHIVVTFAVEDMWDTFRHDGYDYNE